MRLDAHDRYLRIDVDVEVCENFPVMVKLLSPTVQFQNDR